MWSITSTASCCRMPMLLSTCSAMRLSNAPTPGGVSCGSGGGRGGGGREGGGVNHPLILVRWFQVPPSPKRNGLLQPVCGCAGANVALQAQGLARLCQHCQRLAGVQRPGAVLLGQ